MSILTVAGAYLYYIKAILTGICIQLFIVANPLINYNMNNKNLIEKNDPDKVKQFKKDALTMSHADLAAKYAIAIDTVSLWKRRYGIKTLQAKYPADKVLLKLIEKQSHQDIADKYGVGRKTVAVWVQRARKRLHL